MTRGQPTDNRMLRLAGLAGALLILLLIVASILLYADHMRAYTYIEPPRQEQVSEAAEAVRQQRAAEQEVLRSYGWVDEGERIIQVPIELAMDLTTQRGADFVFARPEPAVAAAPPAAPAAAELFNVLVDAGNLPESANFVTIRMSYPDGDVVTTVEMPAAIEQVAVAGTSEGEAVTEPGAPAETAEGVFDWEATGEQAYNGNCAACHQAEGQGVPGAFPTLAGHAAELYDASRNYPINVLLYGLVGEIVVEGQTYNGQMPAFGTLADEDIAAILNHTMTAWGNEAELQDFEPYVPGDVAAERGANLSSQDVYALRQALGLE
jgi:mono/diheme cytochrome c family protein